MSRAGSRVVSTARDALPALALYAVIRAVGFAGLAVVAGADGQSMWARLHSWDALWLTRVAEHGYDASVVLTAAGRPRLTDIVFFPLMPWAMRAVSAVTGLGAYPAGLVVSALAGLAAAVAVDRLGRLAAGPAAEAGRRRATGLVLVAAWASWPHAIVLSMAYTEALFVALAAWSLLMVVRRRWLTAGMLCLLAGATRPTGLAVAGALAVAALVDVVRAVRSGSAQGAWRPVLAVVLAPLGWLAFIGWTGHALGRWDGWFWMEREAWLTHLDGGAYELDRLRVTLTTAGPTVFLLCSLIVLACLVLLVALLLDLAAERTAAVTGALLPLSVYATLVVAMTLATAGYHNSKPRFLMVAFPLLLPLARTLAGAPRRTVVVLLTAAALASAWYGGYLLVVWTASP